MDAAEVESGELRWPPDNPGSPDAQSERRRAGDQTAGEQDTEAGLAAILYLTQSYCGNQRIQQMAL